MNEFVSPFYFFNDLELRFKLVGNKLWTSPQLKKEGREMPFAALIALSLSKYFKKAYFIFPDKSEKIDYKVGYYDVKQKNFTTHLIEQVEIPATEILIDPNQIYDSIAAFLYEKKLKNRCYSKNDMLFCFCNFNFIKFDADKMLKSLEKLEFGCSHIWFMGRPELWYGTFRMAQIYPFVDKNIEPVSPNDNIALKKIYQYFIEEMKRLDLVELLPSGKYQIKK